ncbi:hypothetical protein FXN63_19745 [Pigmentiphaga aceris]|uniref:Uncharacterized protein n=1 Tax=Pigmentiphaga aceris TaxID=1940612 RepID=A0A5C0AZF3_9BURK|nr:hypothetical protein [Pigmentiphaga aceris]QEI07819.1 hypothetical protein FXN63_19745 [Pigmentiphaga aceris]
MPNILDWLHGHGDRFRRVAHVVEGFLLLVLIAGGGGLAGYSAALRADDVLALQRADHQAEIGRLQATTDALLNSKEDQLAWMSVRLEELTASANTAARTSESAAKTSVRASRQAAAAAQVAGATAAAVSSRPNVPESAREALNAAIERTNRAIAEGQP